MQATIAHPSRSPRIRRSVRVGAAASAILAAFYVSVVWGASRSAGHLADQIASDWYFLVPIMAGFGIQIGLVSELRRRHQMRGAAAATGAAGAGSSTVGMIACCAHHIADLAPFIGATGAAAFLTDYRSRSWAWASASTPWG
ncbi:MAG: hypothetical protein WEB06_10725 [Actinomycetota bacterium]